MSGRMNWEKANRNDYIRSFGPDVNTTRLTSKLGGLDRITRKLKQHEDCATCGDTVLATTNARFWVNSKKYTHIECGKPLN